MRYLAAKGEKYILAIAVVATIAVSFFIAPEPTLSQAASPLTGYAWSDTIGWISLNCSNLGTCGTSNYGLSIAADGAISGYAWSENIGWISAQSANLTGCPTAPCTVRMDEYALKGWLRALAYSDSQSGGWDGFISLSGTNYGPTLNQAGDTFTGYAWGDMNIGWLSFGAGTTPVQTTWNPQCSTQYSCVSSTTRRTACQGAVPVACGGSLICSSGACVTPPAPSTAPGDELSIEPRLVRPGGTVVVLWSVRDATSCSVTENSPDFNNTWNATSSAAVSCTHSGNGCVTGAIRGSVTYTLSCTGPGGTLTQRATVFSNPSWKEL